MTAKLGRTPHRRSFAERAVLHFLPADEGPEIVGDLEEARRARFPAGGLRSSVWYWTHVAMLAMSFFVEHARERAAIGESPLLDEAGYLRRVIVPSLSPDAHEADPPAGAGLGVE